MSNETFTLSLAQINELVFAARSGGYYYPKVEQKENGDLKVTARVALSTDPDVEATLKRNGEWK